MASIWVRGGTVIDGNGTAAMPSTDVYIDDGEVVAVGADAGAAAAAAPGEVDQIDATGLTVMPGLVDAHCHSTFDEPLSNDELFFHRDPTIAALTTAFHLPKLLRAGVTSFCDPDTIFAMGPSLRDALRAGIIEGPRMATGVSALLTSVGGTAGRLIPDTGSVGYAEVVPTRDEMVAATRRHIKNGADWIKIHATGSIPTRSGELQVWTRDEMAAVCDTAHDLGVPVMAHCRNASSVRDAALAGVDMVLHASYMDDEGLEAVLANGSTICPTFTFLANLCEYGALVGAATHMIDIFRGEIEQTATMMRRAHDSGVTLLCGSESGFVLTPYGHWHAREMALFVEHLGLTPLESIRCATENGAVAMRLEGRLGRVAPGYLADVLIVDGDPSSDVAVLGDRRNLRAVISQGHLVDLSRPWPEKQPVPGSRVGNWATSPLTWQRAHGAED